LTTRVKFNNNNLSLPKNATVLYDDVEKKRYLMEHNLTSQFFLFNFKKQTEKNK